MKDHSPKKSAIEGATGLVVLLTAILTLKELAEKDHHVQKFFSWLATLVHSGSQSLSGLPVQWVGFWPAFADTTPGAWYSWFLVSLVIAGVLLVILLTCALVMEGLYGEFAEAAKASVGVVATLVALKGAWLLLTQGTPMTILAGVGVGLFTLVVGLGTLAAISDVF